VNRTCLVIGCGYVGRRLAQRLRPAWHVHAVVRSDSSVAVLRSDGLDCTVVDLDAAAVPTALRDTTDGAAVTWLAPPPETGITDSRLESFLDAIDEGRPSVLLYVSTTGVYGDAGGATVTEASPVQPANDRSRRRLAAERFATVWCAARGVRCVVLRVPGIYGPHRLPLARLRRGEPALCPEDAGPGNRIHVDDLVSACVAALERPVRGVFNVGDGDHSSTTVFLQRTAALTGLPAPHLVPMAEARERLSPGMLSYLVESRRVDTRRMREDLLPRLAYPDLEAGIAASLAEMGQAAT
jgi:nucleoside-diphosphate-sugar epimerase